jgi:acyl transferase domain-containing protein
MDTRLKGASEAELADICFTANTGRKHFHRAAAVGATREELGRGLRATLEERSAEAGQIAFLFTGQDRSPPAWAARLYETEPVFRAAMDRCAAGLRGTLPTDLLPAVFSANGASLLDEARFAQPALFAIEYALAELWASWGITPDAVMGHSLGEYVAACVAGAMSLEDALLLVAARGRLMHALPSGGAMAAVMAGADQVAAELTSFSGRAEIAPSTGPPRRSSPATPRLSKRLRRISGGGRRRDAAAGHARVSLAPDRSDARRVRGHRVPHRLPSTVRAADLEPDGCRRRPSLARTGAGTREDASSSSGHGALAALGCRTFVEIGPHPTLTRLGRQCLSEQRSGWVHSLRRGQDDRRQMLSAARDLYLAGLTIDWTNVDRGCPPPCGAPDLSFPARALLVQDRPPPRESGRRRRRDAARAPASVGDVEGNGLRDGDERRSPARPRRPSRGRPTARARRHVRRTGASGGRALGHPPR